MYKFAGTGFLRPQTYWLKDYSGNIPMDFIGKFETLKQDYQHIAQKLGVENIDLPHKIESQQGGKESKIEDKAVSFINDYYAEDFEKLGYKYN